MRCLLIVGLAWVAACGAGAPRGEQGGPPPPPIAWGACPGAPSPPDPGLACGRLQVPLDHAQPRGASLSLFAARARATGARVGALYLNTGGPGGNDAGFIVRRLARLGWLRERLDLVALDPRGVGASEPTVRCAFAPIAPSGDPARDLDAAADAFAAACAAQTGPAVHHLGTNAVARDIDLFRRALGERELNFYGVSYGAELGAVYASLFPDAARAVVLDGGVTELFRDNAVQASIEMAAAHQLALARLDELCRAAPGCPLAGRSLVAALDGLIARGPLTERDVLFTAWGALFTDRRAGGWADLPAMVVAAEAGQVDAWRAPPLDPALALSSSEQVYAAIMCTDFAAPPGGRTRAASWYPQVSTADRVFRHGKISEFELLRRTCQAWPAGDAPVIRDVGARRRHPILLVGNAFDPVTPMAWTRHLAHALGPRTALLSYAGGGHTASSLVLPGVPCVDAQVVRYLTELALPSPGASCAALPLEFARAAR